MFTETQPLDTIHNKSQATPTHHQLLLVKNHHHFLLPYKQIKRKRSGTFFPISNATVQQRSFTTTRPTTTRGNITPGVVNLSGVFVVLQRFPIVNILTHSAIRGPLTVFFFFTLIVTSIVQIVKNHLYQKVLQCTSCRGYGVERCNLCKAKGYVNWEGKFSHLEPCPLCMGKRYISCQQCGGLVHKPLFRVAKISSLERLRRIQQKQQKEESDLGSILDSIAD
eukprot:TRINITY_DN44946_c0_g1_i3.p2 TRINITY_DN44946_c0_g1~~TRINITY_DN44946_c0_g1_i3.p2  ORF type:complete len:259 (+),score=12.15 TRINITY_DN44946_c0_g1_i3:109-777(+)